MIHERCGANACASVAARPWGDSGAGVRASASFDVGAGGAIAGGAGDGGAGDGGADDGGADCGTGYDNAGDGTSTGAEAGGAGDGGTGDGGAGADNAGAGSAASARACGTGRGRRGGCCELRVSAAAARVLRRSLSCSGASDDSFSALARIRTSELTPVAAEDRKEHDEQRAKHGDDGQG